MFPEVRLRRLRQSAGIRKMLDAPLPGPEKFMWPTFVIDGEGKREEIESMPGQFRLSIDQLLPEVESLLKTGIGSVLLFGLA
jgi:porphobilinogen synthase